MPAALLLPPAERLPEGDAQAETLTPVPAALLQPPAWSKETWPVGTVPAEAQGKLQ